MPHHALCLAVHAPASSFCLTSRFIGLVLSVALIVLSSFVPFVLPVRVRLVHPVCLVRLVHVRLDRLILLDRPFPRIHPVRSILLVPPSSAFVLPSLFVLMFLVLSFLFFALYSGSVLPKNGRMGRNRRGRNKREGIERKEREGM